MEDEAREKVVCLHLNPQLEILSYELVGMGSADGVLLDDEKASKELIKWGKGYRIPMQDFVIIGEDGYYSFDEREKLKKDN